MTQNESVPKCAKEVFMRKVFAIVVIVEIFLFINPCRFISCTSYGVDDNRIQNQNKIINTQKDNLQISDFMSEAQEYTKESLPGLDLNNLLSSAISGGIDNVKIMKLFFGLFRKRGFKFSRYIKQYYCNSCDTFNTKNYK